MRSFLEFVPCCGSPTRRAPEPPVPAEDEERWLVPAPVVGAVAAAPSRRPCRKKQRRIGAPEWRPSLGAISEDKAVPPPREPLNGAVASGGRDVKKSSAAGGAAKVCQRSYSDGYNGSSAMAMTMPTFSPTPFMF